MEKRKPTREEAITAAAKIYAHWLNSEEGQAARAKRNEKEEAMGKKARRWLYNMEVNFGPEMARTKKEADEVSQLMVQGLNRVLKEMEAEGTIPAGCRWELSSWQVKWDGADEAHLAVDIDDERTIGSAVAALKAMGYSEEEIADNYDVPLANVLRASGREQDNGN